MGHLGASAAIFWVDGWIRRICRMDILPLLWTGRMSRWSWNYRHYWRIVCHVHTDLEYSEEPHKKHISKKTESSTMTLVWTDVIRVTSSKRILS
jgi:hypothetical protein